MNRERLERLVDILKTVPPEKFDMSMWYSSNISECGTVACAGGYACLDPAFQKLGLHFGYNKIPCYKGQEGIGALRAFFDLPSSVAMRLFLLYRVQPVKPATVIRRIRALLAMKETEC